jgi:hypothetical protein
VGREDRIVALVSERQGGDVHVVVDAPHAKIRGGVGAEHVPEDVSESGFRCKVEKVERFESQLRLQLLHDQELEPVAFIGAAFRAQRMGAIARRYEQSLERSAIAADGTKEAGTLAVTHAKSEQAQRRGVPISLGS